MADIDPPQPLTLQIQPHALPSIRAAFESAIGDITMHLNKLTVGATIQKPWLADDVSKGMHAYYNRTAISQDGAGGDAYLKLTKFRDQLLAARDTLKEMEDRYRATDGDTAERWGRA